MEKWYTFSDDKFDLTPDLIIYIRTTPEKLSSRIQNRGRAEEPEIELEFLQDIHSNHEGWMRSVTNISILVINGDL